MRTSERECGLTSEKKPTETGDTHSRALSIASADPDLGNELAKDNQIESKPSDSEFPTTFRRGLRVSAFCVFDDFPIFSVVSLADHRFKVSIVIVIVPCRLDYEKRDRIERCRLFEISLQ